MTPALILALFAAGPTAWTIDGARSTVAIHVGKSGLLSFAGHEHEVRATQVQGEVSAVPEDLAQSRVSLTFAAGALKVEEKGEPAGDAPKVQEAMLGPKVLDVARFPTITFASTRVTGRSTGVGRYDLEVTGNLTLHGVTRSVVLPLRVDAATDSLTATGRMEIRQTDYGITPVNVAGVVKVKNALAIDYRLVAIPSR
jgi:polyisoprenoid-binding protein YceI